MIINEEQFKNLTIYKMSYDEYVKCYCPDCERPDCVYRDGFDRVPEIDGGKGLCPNLRQN